MRILISNDDGIYAKGIRSLAERLAEDYEVFVVAPDRPKSAAGHGITLHKPLYLEKHDWGNGLSVYAVNGTPADCVKMGVQVLLKDRKPDLVIAGINEGSNLGTDLIYSGTVSAAVEGIIQGIPSMAVSLCGEDFADFTYPASFVAQLVKLVLAKGLDTDTLLNVNIPFSSREAIRGVAITCVGQRRYDNTYEKRIDPRGRPYYWIAGRLLNIANPENSDVNAIANGRISISPVRFVLTNDSFIPALQQWDIRW